MGERMGFAHSPAKTGVNALVALNPTQQEFVKVNALLPHRALTLEARRSVTIERSPNSVVRIVRIAKIISPETGSRKRRGTSRVDNKSSGAVGLGAARARVRDRRVLTAAPVHAGDWAYRPFDQ